MPASFFSIHFTFGARMHTRSNARWTTLCERSALVLIAVISLPVIAQESRIDYYRLVKGFVAEKKNAYGWPEGTGFVSDNPWGQYTAYLMNTNALGQRTFRIEHNLPNPDGKTAQGSTMYLLEGSSRALLIDTANPAKFIEGKNDLKTLVVHLLGHNDDGTPRTHPLDFVVANTHNHPDHIGENSLFSDHTVYYMDLDWPSQAPSNYVPFREGGGPTNHGNGMAVGQIDLGNRLISAVAIPPHSNGSTGFFDAENRMLFTGDAIGSGWPFLQRGPLTTYDESIHHLENLTRPYPDIGVFPSHFYQVAAWSRGKAPLNGRPQDRQYITDMTVLADGVLAGTVVGEPFMASQDAYWATNDTAQMVYTLPNFYRPGENGAPYHAVHLPGDFARNSAGAPQAKPMETINANGADFYLIYDKAGESLFLFRGSKGALLIGSGGGESGLAVFVHSLIGDLPFDVAVLDKDARQTGGLPQLNPRHIYVADSSTINGFPATVLTNGAKIDLGDDRSGKPLVFEASTFHSDGSENLSLLLPDHRVLFAGDVFERHEAPIAMRGAPPPTPELDQAARAAWLAKQQGRFDTVYLSTNTRWFSDPEWLAGVLAPAAGNKARSGQ
jgi:glyoxylase-like metal-dependent hydrolase (beta-lactamase superfamily II)